MNHWLQTRLFTCPKCMENYTHDKAYQHALFLCLKRNQFDARDASRT
jgi:transcription initiation factor IIE alpha subunit